jgi:hypothetical protein
MAAAVPEYEQPRLSIRLSKGELKFSPTGRLVEPVMPVDSLDIRQAVGREESAKQFQ